MSVINSIPLIAAGDDGGYQISRSVRLRSSASAYFNRTPASGGNRQKFTMSVWVKRGSLGGTQNLINVHSSTSGADGIRLDSDKFNFYLTDATGAAISTTAVFRDPSAWYHLVCAVDTTQATASNRVRMYVNGVEQTSFSSSTYPSLNANTSFNEVSRAHSIGRNQPYASEYLDGYITEFNWVDGQQLTPSSFGETDTITGVWKPKRYTGTYGTNGFYLNFSDPSAATAAAIGKDYSGNGNNWTPNNISVTAGTTYDSMLDVPTMYADGGNGRGNYCVLNVLDKVTTMTLSNANLTATTSPSSGFQAIGSMALEPNGKYYFEVIVSGSNNGSLGLYGKGNNTNTNTYTVTPTNTYGVRFDASNPSAGWDISVNGGSWLNNAIGSATAPFFPWCQSFGSTFDFNFGQRPFAYTPPTGFKALNTQNLPDSTIKKGNQFFDATLYTGNGSALTVTNSGSMQPDLLWTKQRSSTAWHYLQDAVRGVNKGLFSNATDAEYSITPTTTTLNSNGFSFNGAESGLNANGATYVAWQWKESASAGFDIVTQTLATTGINTMSHSLGVVPRMILAKRRDGAEQWLVYHASATTQSQYLGLNTTAAVASSANLWGSSALTSSQFFFAGTSGVQYVFYLFADVAGFSRFGSYTGNGSTDGPFVFCGFRPRFIMYKRTNDIGNWNMLDTTRSTFNVSQTEVVANQSIAEFVSANANVDVNANGFKLRTTDGDRNASGGTYIFAAFAENPFKNSLAR